jgi:glyoxylate/hydroxypyruvate reductase
VSKKRVGILSLGRIGSLVPRRWSAIRCPVSYHSRSPNPSAPYTFFPTVLGLASESDVLVLSCVLTEETRHVVDRKVLEALGPGGVLVNVGRGRLIDEPELVRCLRDGVVAGAGIDVVENEPHVPSELFLMDNVVLSVGIDHRLLRNKLTLAPRLDNGVTRTDVAHTDAPRLTHALVLY